MPPTRTTDRETARPRGLGCGLGVGRGAGVVDEGAEGFGAAFVQLAAGAPRRGVGVRVGRRGAGLDRGADGLGGFGLGEAEPAGEHAVAPGVHPQLLDGPVGVVGSLAVGVEVPQDLVGGVLELTRTAVAREPGKLPLGLVEHRGSEGR